MVKLTNTGAACDRSGVKCVVYGRPKVGKTTIIRTAPAPIILSSERGLLPLRDARLPVIEIETAKDLDEAFTWLASSNESRQYQTVCMDSISDISEAILAYERKNNPKKTDNWAPFNKLAEFMTDKLREARNMPGRNWLMICQEETVQTPENTRMAVPSLPGKALLQNLPYLYDGIFQFVLHTDPVTGEQYRMLKTKGDNITLGGDRSGNLEMWEQPDLTKLFAKMLGA